MLKMRGAQKVTQKLKSEGSDINGESSSNSISVNSLFL